MRSSIRTPASTNTSEAPDDRKPGDAPALTDAEIDDIIAFLQTLSDGWQRANN
jgi:cytochrome c peroxidase